MQGVGRIAPGRNCFGFPIHVPSSLVPPAAITTGAIIDYVLANKRSAHPDAPVSLPRKRDAGQLGHHDPRNAHIEPFVLHLTVRLGYHKQFKLPVDAGPCPFSVVTCCALSLPG